MISRDVDARPSRVRHTALPTAANMSTARPSKNDSCRLWRARCSAVARRPGRAPQHRSTARRCALEFSRGVTKDECKPNRPRVAGWAFYILAAALFALIAIGATLAEVWASRGDCP